MYIRSVQLDSPKLNSLGRRQSNMGWSADSEFLASNKTLDNGTIQSHLARAQKARIFPRQILNNKFKSSRCNSQSKKKGNTTCPGVQISCRFV